MYSLDKNKIIGSSQNPLIIAAWTNNVIQYQEKFNWIQSEKSQPLANLWGREEWSWPEERSLESRCSGQSQSTWPTSRSAGPSSPPTCPQEVRPLAWVPWRRWRRGCGARVSPGVAPVSSWWCRSGLWCFRCQQTCPVLPGSSPPALRYFRCHNDQIFLSAQTISLPQTKYIPSWKHCWENWRWKRVTKWSKWILAWLIWKLVCEQQGGWWRGDKSSGSKIFLISCILAPLLLCSWLTNISTKDLIVCFLTKYGCTPS